MATPWELDNQHFNLDSPYGNMVEYQNAYNQLAQQQTSLGSSAREGLVTRLNDAGSQFKELFKNNVGREATNAELAKFYADKGGKVILNSPGGRSEENATDVRNQIAQYVGDTFQPEAQKVAEGKLTDLSSQGASLADQYLSMGKASLGSLANDLQDYQTKLFTRLRPQLNLAAQAGGFQDSGGETMQEQGALRDLGTQAQGILVPLQNQLESNANAIRYGAVSAPYSLATSFAANQPNVLANTGAGALSSNVDWALANMSNAAAMARLQFQGGVESNLLKDKMNFGNNFGQSLGSGLGGNLSSWFSPPAASDPGGGGGHSSQPWDLAAELGTF